jgi:hypothetical protein
LTTVPALITYYPQLGLQPCYAKRTCDFFPERRSCLLGKKGAKGVKRSEETKAKISASKKGHKFTEEHKANMSASRFNKGVYLYVVHSLASFFQSDVVAYLEKRELGLELSAT